MSGVMRSVSALVLVLLVSTSSSAQQTQELRWGGDAEGDTLHSIQNLTGSWFGDDLLIGDDADNVLSGLDGNAFKGGSPALMPPRRAATDGSERHRRQPGAPVAARRHHSITSSRRSSPSAQRMAPAIGRWLIWRAARGYLGATLAYDLLTAAQRDHGVVPVTYETTSIRSDLTLGRVDAAAGLRARGSGCPAESGSDESARAR
jgi:hypothetical protein